MSKHSMADVAHLSGRHAVVTGGGTGIGAAIAGELDKLGVTLTLLGRRLKPLEDRRKTLANANALVADVTDEESVNRAFEEAIAHSGPVSILVNNAGAAQSMPLSRTGKTVWQNMLDVNLGGVFLCTRAFVLQAQADDYGRIISVASTAGLKGYPYVTAYCAAKHGVVGFTRALALELADKNITVNAVCPGYTDTELISGAVDNIVSKTGRGQEETLGEFVKANPQGRLVTPEEVASAVAWLCLPESQAITGQSIAIAGGEVM